MKTIVSYVHHDGSIGVLVRFECGSDFTSRTDEFRAFANTAAMSLAAYSRNETSGEAPPLGPEGDGERPSDDSLMHVDWVGPDVETLRAAVQNASKLFREQISIDAVTFMHASDSPRSQP